jgi:hypothetical protein
MSAEVVLNQKKTEARNVAASPIKKVKFKRKKWIYPRASNFK